MAVQLLSNRARPSIIALASAIIVAYATPGMAQQPLSVVLDSGTARAGTAAGSRDAREVSVTGRAVLGFLGGLPTGFMLAPALVQGDPSGIGAVGLGLAIVEGSWRLGDVTPPNSPSFAGKGKAYQRAYIREYGDLLLERRKKATRRGGMAGGIAGAGLFVLLISQMTT